MLQHDQKAASTEGKVLGALGAPTVRSCSSLTCPVKTIDILQDSYRMTYLGVECVVSENEKACPRQALGNGHADFVGLSTSCRDRKRWSVIPTAWLCRYCYVRFSCGFACIKLVDYFSPKAGCSDGISKIYHKDTSVHARM